MNQLHESLRLALLDRGLGAPAANEVAQHLEEAILRIHHPNFYSLSEDAQLIAKALQRFAELHDEEQAIQNMILNQQAKIDDIEASEVPAHVANMYSGNTF